MRLQNKEMNNCKHDKFWSLGDGLYEWCYTCGAIRFMGELEDNKNLVPLTDWTEPTLSDKNPFPPPSVRFNIDWNK